MDDQDTRQAPQEVFDLLMAPVPTVGQAMALVQGSLSKGKASKSSGMVQNPATPEEIAARAAARALAKAESKALKKAARAERKRQTKSYREHNRLQEITNDVNTARIQLFRGSIDNWKDTGLLSYLMMTHANSNQFLKYSEDKMLTRTYSDTEIQQVNTARFGLTEDKGFIGYKNNQELPYVSVQPILDSLGLSMPGLIKIMGGLRAKTSYSKYRDLYITEQATASRDILAGQAAIQETVFSEAVNIGESTFYDDWNNLTVTDAGRGRGDVTSTILNLYIIGDIIFTTSNSISLATIDAYQSGSFTNIPCSGIIQDMLTEQLLMTKQGDYFCNGSRNAYNILLANPFWEEVTANGIPQLSYDYRGVSASYYPITAVQRGSSSNQLFRFKITSLSDSNKEIKMLPLGDIMPLGKFIRLETDADNEDDSSKIMFTPLSLVENGMYPVESLYVFRDITLDTNHINLYKKEDLINIDKQAMYSQAIIQTQQKIKEIIKKVAESSSVNIEIKQETVATEAPMMHQSLSASASYMCPTAIKTSKEFTI